MLVKTLIKSWGALIAVSMLSLGANAKDLTKEQKKELFEKLGMSDEADKQLESKHSVRLRMCYFIEQFSSSFLLCVFSYKIN